MTIMAEPYVNVNVNKYISLVLVHNISLDYCKWSTMTLNTNPHNSMKYNHLHEMDPALAQTY